MLKILNLLFWHNFIDKYLVKCDFGGNKYLFTVPYTPKTNAIEMWFNQIKHSLKLNKKVLKFNELKLEVKKSIRKVKKITMKIILSMLIIKK